MRVIVALAVCLLASSLTASGLNDIVESLAARADETSVSSEVEVVELFQAQTPQELEAALTDGYPMPWLEEILNDESIPEEDRYWLDCRMRAVYAQDLHLFFNREGNPIHVEAEWIAPGEDYWREHMMVDPVGRTKADSIDRPRLAFGDPGYILNLYGEKVGELAMVHRFVSLSRDASIAAGVSGGATLDHWNRQPYACLMYPDGSFIEIPFDTKGDYSSIVSNNGSIIVFLCLMPLRSFDERHVPGDALIFDREGNLINRIPQIEFGSGEDPIITPSGQFTCNNLDTGELCLIDCLNGTVSMTINPSEGGRTRSNFNFNPNGRYLCAGGHSAGLIIDLETSEMIWEGFEPVGVNAFSIVHCSNNAECISITMKQGDHPNYRYDLEVYLEGRLVYEDTATSINNSETLLSPNGCFLLTRRNDFFIGDTSLPTIIREIRWR